MKLPQLRAGGVDLVHAGRRVIKEIGDDDISGAAAELAYRTFLAVFPFFIFLTAMGGFIARALDVADPTEEIMDLLEQSLPADAASLLQRELDNVIESSDAGLLSIGFAGAIWSASSGMGTIMKAMNRIYEAKESRPFLKRSTMAVGLTLLGGGLVIAAFLLVVVGQFYALEVAEAIGMEGPAAIAFSIARWPAVIVGLLASLAFLYWAAPNVDLPFKWITPGAVFAALGWLVMTFLFGLYVANLGSYNATYGALGAVVITLIWFFLSSFVLLLGAEINAVLAQEAMSQTPGPSAGEVAMGAGKREDDPGAAQNQAGAGPGRFALLTGLVVALVTLERLRKR